MKATITNTSRAAQGVWSDKGLVLIEPGQSVALTIAEYYVERALSLPFLTIVGEGENPPSPVKPDPLDHDGNGRKGGAKKAKPTE